MPVITFWSNNEKAIGQSIAASVAATVMAIEHNYKVLLISADFNNNTIEESFGAQESNKEILKSLVKRQQINLESGINGLLKLAESNRVTPEVIHDYTKIVFTNRLEILYSPIKVAENQKKGTMQKLKNIILNASRYYDQVIVDLRKGLEYSEQVEILDSSDVIVANVDQKMKNIEEFFNIEIFDKIYHKIIWNICRHNKDSKYNIKNLSRTIFKKQVVCQTNYNTLISDVAQEGNLAELMLRFRSIKEDEETVEFMKKINELNEAILLRYQELRTRM